MITQRLAQEFADEMNSADVGDVIHISTGGVSRKYSLGAFVSVTKQGTADSPISVADAYLWLKDLLSQAVDKLNRHQQRDEIWANMPKNRNNATIR